LCILFIVNIFPVEKELSNLAVHFIDVGQGDSVLIETPNNKIILIDGGPPESGHIVTDYLKKQGISSIDLLVNTHPHIDHIGGLKNVIKHIPIKQLIHSGQPHTTTTYRQYIKLLSEKKIPMQVVKEGDYISIHPLLDIDILNGYEKGNTHNEAALVLHITYNEKRFLLMSDVEHKQEKDMLEGKPLRSDIIKIGHHGSKTSSSHSFLQAVNPDVAFITYDVENDYGHPAKKVIDRLQHVNTNIYSTATFGHVQVVTDGKRYVIMP